VTKIKKNIKKRFSTSIVCEAMLRYVYIVLLMNHWLRWLLLIMRPS